ncbi:Rieske (2Fe-2S) protein [Paenibacillus roseipurpureus]|uniref:Rieske (2Fe-2S) protein n=1 Tax=Paenibacillus roseopurpureus TaxID=2918901 RepID=A0AA96RI75_9BACL|nr:Rieske (2Fe-2S) protein [Paenibacillus sp. MBLB1832]WNR44043.1 Rieske (2Fe-2S) protein [Paenibacillus sp. MBLB1832]
MAHYYVAEASSIPEGDHRIIEIEGRSIGIYNIKGEYHALANYCPHEGAELCKGPVCGTTMPSKVNEYIYGRDQEIVRCPWHGWEFDIKTGKSLFSEKVRTRKYALEIKDGQIHVIIGA